MNLLELCFKEAPSQSKTQKKTPSEKKQTPLFSKHGAYSSRHTLDGTRELKQLSMYVCMYVGPGQHYFIVIIIIIIIIIIIRDRQTDGLGSTRPVVSLEEGRREDGMQRLRKGGKEGGGWVV